MVSSHKSPAKRRRASSPVRRRKSLNISNRSPVKRHRHSSPSVKSRKSTRSTYTIRSKRRSAKNVALSSGERTTFYVSATEFGGRYKVPIRINNPRLAAVRFISRLGSKRAFVYTHPAGGIGMKFVAHPNPKNPRLPIVRSGRKFQSPTKSHKSPKRRAPRKKTSPRARKA